MSHSGAVRLLLITPLYPPAVGGAATYSKLLVDHLERFDVVDRLLVLTKLWGGESPVQHVNKKTTVLRWLAPGFNRSSRYPVRTWFTFQYNRFVFPRVVRFLVKRFDVNVVHAHMVAFLSFSNVFRQLDVPRVIDFRGFGCGEVDIRSLAEGCDHVICGARNIYEHLLSRGFSSARITYLPLPFEAPRRRERAEIDAVLAHYAIPRGRPYIAYIGDISARKGVYLLLDAFDRLRNTRCECSLVLAGKNMEGRAFHSKLRGRKDRLYVGAVPHEDALAIMEGAEVLALLSQEEGLPRACLEAIALGKKIVCGPGVNELGEFCGEFLVESLTAEQAEAKIRSVLHSRKSPTYPFQHHDPQVVARRLVELYTAVRLAHRQKD